MFGKKIAALRQMSNRRVRIQKSCKTFIAVANLPEPTFAFQFLGLV